MYCERHLWYTSVNVCFGLIGINMGTIQHTVPDARMSSMYTKYILPIFFLHTFSMGGKQMWGLFLLLYGFSCGRHILHSSPKILVEDILVSRRKTYSCE